MLQAGDDAIVHLRGHCYPFVTWHAAVKLRVAARFRMKRSVARRYSKHFDMRW